MNINKEKFEKAYERHSALTPWDQACRWTDILFKTVTGMSVYDLPDTSEVDDYRQGFYDAFQLDLPERREALWDAFNTYAEELQEMMESGDIHQIF